MSQSIAVDVRILDKEYRVMCPLDERDDLIASARELDKRMQEIRDHSRIIGSERIAVIAALNLMHELLQKEAQQQETDRSLNKRLAHIAQQIDDALSA